MAYVIAFAAIVLVAWAIWDWVRNCPYCEPKIGQGCVLRRGHAGRHRMIQYRYGSDFW